jgi:hypothetical protein
MPDAAKTLLQMNTARLNAILALLPKGQRESAAARITESESFGWRDIHLCRLPGQVEPSDEKDLIGEKANGEIDFLP